jgi:hypothetical protein
MSGSETLTWNLIVNDSRAVRGLGNFGSALSRAQNGVGRFRSLAGTAFKAIGVGAAVGIGVAAGALTKWVVQGVKDAASYQKVLAKTAQVIKTTGGAAGVTAGKVKDLAAELETMSGVDEELIINSENVLMTFTNIRNVGKNRIFDMATKSALDMSVALGSDLQGASIQVGKALNDPIKGVTALSKVGVTFSQKQKDVIKSLVETGDVAGAQKVILAELNKEFGGQAEAAGKGFEGTMARLQDVIGDTGREVGTALLPKITELVTWLSDKIPQAVQDFKDGWKGIGDGQDINGLATALHDLSDQLANINKQAGDVNQNGIVRFVKSGINALTTFIESFSVLGANWHLITTRIEQWNKQIGISWNNMIENIAEGGAKLPGPIGRHFQKIRDDAKARSRELQGDLDKINTRRAQAELTIAEVNLKRLGRQHPSPKVSANIRDAQLKIDRIQAKLRGIRDENVNVFIQEVNRDRVKSAIGKRAGGGDVMADQAYWVGENGPELWVPKQPGRVLDSTRSKMLALRAKQAARAAMARKSFRGAPVRKSAPTTRPAPATTTSSSSDYSSGPSTIINITLQFSGRPLTTLREIRECVIEAFRAAPAGSSPVKIMPITAYG